MANIQLIDQPCYLTDEEVKPGANVRGMTWVKAAAVINWLNFCARKVMPWTRDPSWSLGASDFTIQKTSFIFPADGVDFTTRFLVVVVGLTGATSAPAGGDVEFKIITSTDATGDTQIVSLGSGTLPLYQSEENTFYMLSVLAITGGHNELVTLESIVHGSEGARIDGFGAWELPPSGGGSSVAVASDGGLSFSTSSILSSVTGVLDALNYYSSKPVDTDLAAMQTALETAWANNRRIICSLGAQDLLGAGSDWLSLGIGGAVSTWTSVLSGGIFVPPYMTREGVTYRKIRVAVATYRAGAGAAKIRIHTSKGYYPSSSGDSFASSGANRWWQPGNAAWDPATSDGYAVEVGTSGEWITIELYQDTSGVDPVVNQVIIWEDDPV